MPSLFTEDGCFTDEANALDLEVSAAIRPLFTNHQQYNTREIFAVITMAVAGEMYYQQILRNMDRNRRQAQEQDNTVDVRDE
jgi:hypothetical protein